MMNLKPLSDRVVVRRVDSETVTKGGDSGCGVGGGDGAGACLLPLQEGGQGRLAVLEVLRGQVGGEGGAVGE